MPQRWLLTSPIVSCYNLSCVIAVAFHHTQQLIGLHCTSGQGQTLRVLMSLVMYVNQSDLFVLLRLHTTSKMTQTLEAAVWRTAGLVSNVPTDRCLYYLVSIIRTGSGYKESVVVFDTLLLHAQNATKYDGNHPKLSVYCTSVVSGFFIARIVTWCPLDEKGQMVTLGITGPDVQHNFSNTLTHYINKQVGWCLNIA